MKCLASNEPESTDGWQDDGATRWVRHTWSVFVPLIMPIQLQHKTQSSLGISVFCSHPNRKPALSIFDTKWRVFKVFWSLAGRGGGEGMVVFYVL